jgi:hypothetical protein
MSATDTQPPKSADGPFTGYAEPAQRPPFKSYASFAAVFNGSVAAALVAARRSGRELPDRTQAGDLVLVGVASHKISRLVSKDKITAVARAPFTEFQEKGEAAEVEERARGTGVRRAIGELLICPYCLAQWIAGAFAVGHVTAPRLTRLLASMWTAHALADAAQLAYSAAEKRA